jgi:acetate---CoA ligase (ADP-forming)
VRVLNDGLAAVFEPRRIALIGASDQKGKQGELFWRNLSSFPGEVVPISSAETVAGRKAYRTLTAVDGEVDLAVIVVPAAAVPGVLRDAAAKGVRAAVVISGGFAETGPEGARLQAESVAVAREGGVRLVGPNCFGVQNCDLPLNASISAGAPPGGGGISLVTQSGAYGMAIHTLGLDEQLRFAKVYAAGNKADIGDAELLRYLGDDPASRTLCFFLESLSDGRAFVEDAALITADKPVIVAKTGRSVAGARAAVTHTAALAGNERVWRAALAEAGVVLARSGLEMMDVARALDLQPPPSGPRVAVITNSGGTGVELTDLLADEGLDVPELSSALQDELRGLLPAFASARNPIDITPVWSRFGELYPLLVDRLARSGEVDAVVPILLQRSATDPTVASGLVATVERLRADDVQVPVYVCWVAPRSARPNADRLQDAGVPCFEWPERTARAIGQARRYGVARARARAGPGIAEPAVASRAVVPPAVASRAVVPPAVVPPAVVPPAVVPPAVAPRPAGLLPLPPGLLDPESGAHLLAALGIPTIPGRVCSTVSEALGAALELGYPVVAKVVHATIAHKSDVHGVRLGLSDEHELEAAAAELLALAADARVLVQSQGRGIEVVVGAVRDPQFGPVVMVGLGGVFVESLDDVALALAPLVPDRARRLLGNLRGASVLQNAHGGELVDLDALCALVAAAGDLVTAVPEIAAVDLNPVLVTAQGCTAVDWRILVENLPSQGEAGQQDSPRHAGESAGASP